MRKHAVVGLVVALIVLAGCSRGGSTTAAGTETGAGGYRTWASHDAIVEDAKQEGSLKVLTSMQEETNAAIKKGFEAKYPFIDLDIQEQTGSDDQRILLEVQSGASDVDVLHTSGESYPDYLPYLEHVDLLKMASNGTLDMPKEMIDPGQPEAMAAGSGLGGFAYNKKLLPAADVPKTWGDFLSPKFKGKQFLADIEPTNLASLAAAWGEDKLKTYAAAIGSQQPIWSRGDTVSLTAMAAGQYKLIVGSNYHSSFRAQKKSPDTLAIGLLDPVPVRLTQLQSIRKGADHPAAGVLFLEYLASADVQEALDELEPMQSSIYAPGSALNELTKGRQVSVLGWDNFQKLQPWEQLILKEWGFPTAQVKEKK
jgi:iron(III) transport system substrate-binding protein